MKCPDISEEMKGNEENKDIERMFKEAQIARRCPKMNGKKLMRISVTAILVVFMLAMFTAGASAEGGYTFVTKWPEAEGPPSWYDISRPHGIAVDSSGYVYVVDDNWPIKKFDPDGNLIAKWGAWGWSGLDGQFNQPEAITVDSSGNVYVTDGADDRIQKFDADGNFVTKWGSDGDGDGEFSVPCGIAVDSSGNVYVADTYNNRIQKFDSDGTFITKWGSYGTGNGQFDHPHGIAVRDDDLLCVADTQNHRIQVFDSDGTFLTKWGSYGTRNGQFISPKGIAVSSTNHVFVTDYAANRVQKFYAGEFITKWGSEGTEDGEFDRPEGIAVDSSGKVYVADYLNDRIQKFDFHGIFITKWGSGGTGNGEFFNPCDIAVRDDDLLCVADTGNNRIQVFDSDGTFLTKWGSYGYGEGEFRSPKGIAVHSTNHVFVCDWENSRIQKFYACGFITEWGSWGEGEGEFYWPVGIAIDSSGNVYVVDTGNNRIQKFDFHGNFIATWGSFGYGEGEFISPEGIAIDSSDNVYVVDSSNYRIQKFDSDGNFIREWGERGSGDGEFGHPEDIAVDSSGNVFVADSGNYRIQKFDSNGNFITKWGSSGTGEGEFKDLEGIAVDSSGNVYVADSGNNRIQKFAPEGPLLCTDPDPPSHDFGSLLEGQISDWTFDINNCGSGGTLTWTVSDDQAWITVSPTSGYTTTQTDTATVTIDTTSLECGITHTGTITVSSNGGTKQGLITVYVSEPGGEYNFITKWGSYGTGDREFDGPKDIAVDSSGNVYVVDCENHRIQKFDSHGNFITKWGSYGTGDGEFRYPRGIAVDSSGNVYVTEFYENIPEFIYYARIQKFDSVGNFITKWGDFGAGNGEFYWPCGITVDSSGNVYVADAFNHRIQKFDSVGTFITKWGSHGTGDGEFDDPKGIAVDSSGTVYVADTDNERIQKFDSDGTFITKWGSHDEGEWFWFPEGIAVDSGGNVYVADTWDNHIQKFDSVGTFITKWGSHGTGDGEFDDPEGIAVDNSGNVYVADSDNNRIQKFAPGAEVPPAPTVLKPNGGEEIPGGSIYDILWDVKKGTYELAANPISISYTVNSGATWNSIASGLPDDRRYSWTVPNTDTSSNCLVKVEAKDVHDNTGDDTSNSKFTILQTADSTSETIPAGETETVEGPPETGTTVDVTATEDVTITIASYSENPHPEAPEPATMVPKYIDISASDNDCVSWPIYVEMRYADEEIAGLDESSLGLHYYKAGAWHRCSNTGVNAAENYVWAYVAEDECAGSPFVSGGAEAEKEPDIWIDPTSLDLTLPTNTIQDYTMMIGNDGEAALTYVISDTNTLTATATSAQFELSLETAVVALVKSHGHTVKLKPPASITYPISAIPHEISYDDGTAEDGYAWTLAGSRWAVRFTPLSYPADLDIARICLCENWPDVDHETFAVEVYDDDGAGGSPGTLLGTVTTTATAWGWHDVDISGLGITITSGDFYIAYKQLTDYPNCEGLCIDETDPQGRSWDNDGEEWTNDPSGNPGNWMIRCVVDLPEGCSWLDEIPKSGSVPPGGYDEITVTIDTTGLPEGDYSANIVIANNDPDEDPTSVPVDLTVIEEKPEITSFAPPSHVIDTICTWRTFNVTVNQLVDVSWYLNDALQQTNESAQEARCRLHAEVAGEHNVTAIARNANGMDMQTWIWNVTEESSHTFECSAGWNMISFPVEPLDKDADTIFGPEYYYLCTWDSVAGGYVSINEVETGIGYWLLVLEDRSVTVLGTPLSEYNTDLAQGWNMIGSLWTATNVPYGTETVPADQRDPHFYTWCGDHYELTQDIDPGLGYWALAYVDCELHVFPAPPAAPLPLQQITWGDNDWRVRLALTSGAGTDVAEFGLHDSATDDFSAKLDVPEPPSPPPSATSPYQQVYFYNPENPLVKKLSTSYIPHHFVDDDEECNSWLFRLDYSGDASDVTVTWNAEDINAVPAEYSLLFIADSEQIDMRTTPSYTFRAKTGTYEFEIRAITGGKKPDLVIEDSYDKGKAGRYTVFFVVKNIGTATAPKGHYATLYVDGVEIEKKLVSTDLEPGETYKSSFKTKVGLTGKVENIKVCADSYNDVDELDEANNCLKGRWQPVAEKPPTDKEAGLT